MWSPIFQKISGLFSRGGDTDARLWKELTALGKIFRSQHFRSSEHKDIYFSFQISVGKFGKSPSENLSSDQAEMLQKKII